MTIKDIKSFFLSSEEKKQNDSSASLKEKKEPRSEKEIILAGKDKNKFRLP